MKTIAELDTVSETLKFVLDDMGVELRENTRAGRVEYRKNAGDWQPLTEAVRTCWRTRDIPKNYATPKGEGKTKAYLLTQPKFDEAIMVLSHDRQEDPMDHDYLRLLPEIDLTSDQISWIADETKNAEPSLLIDRIFQDLFDLQPAADSALETTDEQEIRWQSFCSRMIYLAAVHRTYRPGCKYDLLITVSGPQGAGKDTLFTASLPQLPNQALYTTQLDLSSSLKEKVEQIMGTVFSISSELAGLTRMKDIEAFKGFSVAQVDRVRLAYRRDTEDHKRACIFLGTTNYDRPIPYDQTGNRRWAVVKLKHRRAVCPVEQWFEEIIDDPRFPSPLSRRDIIWAEAVALYKSDATDKALRLPDNLIPVQKSKNGAFSDNDVQMQTAWDSMVNSSNFGSKSNKRFDADYPFTSSCVAYCMGITHSLNEFVRLPRIKQNQMNRFLEGQGYKRSRVRLLTTHDESVRVQIWHLDGANLDEAMDMDVVNGSAYERPWDTAAGKSEITDDQKDRIEKTKKKRK